METLTFKELAQYMELIKQRAELDFKHNYLKEKGHPPSQVIIDQRLRVLDTIKNIESKMARFNITFVLLSHDDIQNLNQVLSAHSVNEVADALSKKAGPLYGLLLQKSTMMKRNLDSRYEVAKLLLFAHTLPGPIKESILATLKKGSISEDLLLDSIPESMRFNIIKILSRIGILPRLPDESCVVLDNYPVWVPVEHSVRLEESFKRIKTITARLQVLQSSAQPSDQNEVQKLQQEYLVLLKEQDSLLASTKEEEKRASIIV